MPYRCTKCGASNLTWKNCLKCGPANIVDDKPLAGKAVIASGKAVVPMTASKPGNTSPMVNRQPVAQPLAISPKVSPPFPLSTAQSGTHFCEECGKLVVAVEKGWGPNKMAGCPVNMMHRLLAKTHMPPQQDQISQQPLDIIAKILSMTPDLDESRLLVLALISKRFRAAAAYLFQKAQVVPRAIGYASTSTNLENKALQLAGQHKSVAIAVDQLTQETVLETLLKRNIKLDVVLGSTDAGPLNDALRKFSRNISGLVNAKAFHKMHNKYWVFDSDGIFLGSPNISYPGMVEGNSETCIYVRSPYLAKVFLKYLDFLKKPSYRADDPDLIATRKALVTYNKQQHGVRAALAPSINITDFIAQEIQGAVKLTVRQYLIGRPDPRQGGGTDIIETLIEMAENGCDIEVFIDESAYKEKDFVQLAVKDLISAGITVYTQKPCFVVDGSKEKMMHDKLILAEFQSGMVRTLIGSAGVTKDVIANTNAESFLALDLPDVYATFMQHQNASLKLYTTKNV